MILLIYEYSHGFKQMFPIVVHIRETLQYPAINIGLMDCNRTRTCLHLSLHVRCRWIIRLMYTLFSTNNGDYGDEQKDDVELCLQSCDNVRVCSERSRQTSNNSSSLCSELICRIYWHKPWWMYYARVQVSLRNWRRQENCMRTNSFVLSSPIVENIHKIPNFRLNWKKRNFNDWN